MILLHHLMNNNSIGRRVTSPELKPCRHLLAKPVGWLNEEVKWPTNLHLPKNIRISLIAQYYIDTPEITVNHVTIFVIV